MTIHLSEILNITEARLGLEKATQFLENILALISISIRFHSSGGLRTIDPAKHS